ncbi:MAG: DUF4350 domain-containing protein [Gemmatimonadota bacterium]
MTPSILPRRARPFILVATLLAAPAVIAQQMPDTLFSPTVGAPAFASGTGPRLMIDGGHHNFHTVDGRYAPFARLAARDGYRVRGGTGELTDAALREVDLLVIANALAAVNAGDNWSLPTPSAYTDAEIAAVRRWVERGGQLLLVADHMPFGGSTAAFGAAFGISWWNGFAYDSTGNSLLRFSRRAGLPAHPILAGRSAAERVDSLVAFIGSAFRLTGAGAPLMVLPTGAYVLLPQVAWQFSAATPREPVGGMLQGAALAVGRGRVVAAGEAAMFSAQRAGPQGATMMGFNSPTAPQNAQFVLNVLHWLSGLLPKS